MAKNSEQLRQYAESKKVAEKHFNQICKNPVFDDEQIAIVNMYNWYASESEPKKRREWAVAAAKERGVDGKIVSMMKTSPLNMFSDCHVIHSLRMIDMGAPLSDKASGRAEGWLSSIVGVLKSKLEVKTKHKKKEVSNAMLAFETYQDDVIVHGKTPSILELCDEHGATKSERHAMMTKLCGLWMEIKTFAEDYGMSQRKANKVANILLEESRALFEAKPVRRVSTKPRKPRAKKKKPADKVVAKVVCMDSHKDYGQSIDKTKLVGAKRIVLFDTKDRYLKILVGDNMTISGSSVKGFDEKQSITKKLRKPDEILPWVGNVARCNKLMSDLTTKPKKVNGRINKYMLILKAK